MSLTRTDIATRNIHRIPLHEQQELHRAHNVNLHADGDIDDFDDIDDPLEGLTVLEADEADVLLGWSNHLDDPLFCD